MRVAWGAPSGVLVRAAKARVVVVVPVVVPWLVESVGCGRVGGGSSDAMGVGPRRPAVWEHIRISIMKTEKINYYCLGEPGLRWSGLSPVRPAVDVVARTGAAAAVRGVQLDVGCCGISGGPGEFPNGPCH
jgi:hypothetical protein